MLTNRRGWRDGPWRTDRHAQANADPQQRAKLRRRPAILASVATALNAVGMGANNSHRPVKGRQMESRSSAGTQVSHAVCFGSPACDLSRFPLLGRRSTRTMETSTRSLPALEEGFAVCGPGKPTAMAPSGRVGGRACAKTSLQPSLDWLAALPALLGVVFQIWQAEGAFHHPTRSRFPILILNLTSSFTPQA